MFGASKSGTSSPVYGDPYYNYVTALLPGNGTNGAQNNTFVDSSTNNFTITRNGNTTQGTFSPFGDLWSNYFDGSGDYIRFPASADWVLSGDFTIEAWVAVSGARSGGTSSANDMQIFRNWTSGNIFQMYVYGDATQSGLGFGLYSQNGAFNINYAYTFGKNVFYHLAATRQGSTVRLFLNGTLVQTGTSSATFGVNNVFEVGGQSYNTDDFFGYISNFRLVAGTALYTASFTPSTTPLTAVANTKLLTCQSNRFVDNSSSNRSVSVFGTPSVQRFCPFGTTSAYDSATLGGSGYFDGSGDYLSVPDSSAFTIGSNNFTIEAWIYTSAANNVICSHWGTVATDCSFLFYLNAGKLRLSYGSGGTNTGVDSTSSVPTNQWVHVVATCTSGTIRYFINGVLDATTFTTVGALNDCTQPLYVGAYLTAGSGITSFFAGYISNLRFVNGTAVYTSNFTPPTAPLTAITNTSLLLNTINAGIIDNAMMNDLETAGNAQISTTQSKWGGGSMYFDGTGDYLTQYPSSLQNYTFNTGDFTVEAWVYIAGNSALDNDGVRTANIATCINRGSGATQTGWLFYINGNSTTTGTGIAFGLYVSNTAYSISGTTTVSQGVWHHIAVSRSGTTTYLFLDGILVTSGTLGNQSITTLYPLDIGGTPWASNQYNRYLNGYIDDFRITKGYARYTTNFNVPTAAFPTFGGVAAPAPPYPTTDPEFEYVTALLHGDGTNGAQNNTFIDSSTNNFAVTRYGNTTQGTFTPFGTLWSNYFDGSNDYLTVPAGTAFAYGTGAFTIEAWVNCFSFSTNPIVWAQTVSGTNYFVLNFSTSGFLQFMYATSGAGTVITSSTAISVNTWNHIAVVREGLGAGQTKIYINGVSAVSGACAQDFTNTTYVPTIGRYTHTNSLDFAGYISSLRVVKGTAVYTSNFTPSTTPLTAIANTQLLTCQSARPIDGSANNFTVTANGNVSSQRFSPFIPAQPYGTATIGGSGYFDGSDSLSLATTPALVLNIGPTAPTFTIECWIYTATATGIILDKGSQPSASIMNYRLSVQTNFIDFGWGAGDLATYSNYSTPAGSLPFNNWSHVAVVSNAGALTIYINGVSQATGTLNSTYVDNGKPLFVGSRYATDQYYTGYISNLRIVKGTAVYTSSFTPSTTPLTAITNTSLLLGFTNGAIFDNAMMADYETLGNSQISTTQKKFGTGSLYFDGTGDWLKTASSPQFAMGTGDFTWEAWIYFASGATYRQIFSTRTTNSSSTAAGSLAVNTTNGLTWWTSAAIVSYATALPLNQWVHVAVSRSGTTLRVYVNGSQVGSATNSDNLTAQVFSIGANNDGTEPFNGYIDDVRITKGYARYTSAFVPPTGPFPNN